MAKNRLSMLPKQQTPAMPPAHPHTGSAAAASLLNQDDEDNDICPVCDGECICDNKPMVFPQPTSPTQHSIQFVGSSSSLASRPHPPLKSIPLKIKLTVPPNFLGNKQYGLPSNKLGSSSEMTSAPAHDGEASSSITQPNIRSYPPPLKRRGRPQKTSTATRGVAPRLQPASPSPSHSTQPFISKNVGNNKYKKSGPPQKQGLKADRSGPKRTQNRKRRVASDEDDNSSLSNLTDTDHHCDGDDDGGSVSFPTFLSASAFSSMESGNSSDSSESENPSFGTDSDIEKEEESFIVSEAHQKARLRRELLGDDGPRARNPHGDWVIRPRKKSVGSSGSEMNVDSDGTGEEEEEEEEEEGEEEEDPDEDAEETDEKSVGTGLVTAWSEGDESSFDADLFFSNLTDSDTNTDSSCSPTDNGDGEDGDHSDMDTASSSDIAELVAQRQGLENLQLEVTEGWDGQIIFTNGLSDDRGILDIDFEVDASQFKVEASPSPIHESDMDVSSTSVGASDEGRYEEDGGYCEGDTTDEELVGEDNLPNERAMQMFNLPFNVSAIDPLSTVSPVVSPAPLRHALFSRNGSLGPPKPEDILSGKVFWDSDDHDRDSFGGRRAKSRSQSSGKGNSPRTGLFVPVQETRRAIIDGSKEVPSPHPRFNRHRGRSNATRVNLVEQMLRKRMLASRSRSTFTTTSELLSPLQTLSSDNDFGSPSSLPLATLAGELEPLPNTIGLDDVLEASFLAPESSESTGHANGHFKRVAESADEGAMLAPGKHLQNMSRWDVISVGAFRQTRENGGWSSDCTHAHTSHSSVDYGNIMKASPLSSIMWPKEKKEKEKERGKERRRRKRQEPMAISPVILPVRDGDRTPTGSGSQQQNDSNHKFNKHAHKGRKETKRERKLKKKSWGPVHHQHSHHHQWHHTHQHHPNSKTRGSAAAQRPFLAAVPPFSL